MRIYILTLIFFFIIQNDEDNRIEWSQYRRLEIDDFIMEHKPERKAISSKFHSIAHAISHIETKITFKGWFERYPYDVRVYLIKNKSWISDTISLPHEQIHFDIAEIKARKIRKFQVDYFKLDKISEEDFNAKFDNLLCEKINLHEEFDIETLNEENSSYHNRLWRKRVDSILLSLDNYKIDAKTPTKLD